MTTHCEPRTHISEKCLFTVYDSPGVPDTTRSETFGSFDAIVETIRGLTSLNAIAFVIKSDRQEGGDYGVFRTLLKQFSKLPCSIVVVCRVDTTYCKRHPGVKLEKEGGARELKDGVIDKSQLRYNRVHKFLLHHGDLGLDDVNVLRCFLCTMPGLGVSRGTVLITGEVKARYKALRNEPSRIEKLREEGNDLVKSLEKVNEEIHQLQDRIKTLQSGQWVMNGMKNMAGSAVAAIPRIMDNDALGIMVILEFGVELVAAGAQNWLEAQVAGLKGELEKAKNNRAHDEAENNRKTEEIDSGKVDSVRLQEARKEWEELEKLLDH